MISESMSENLNNRKTPLPKYQNPISEIGKFTDMPSKY